MKGLLDMTDAERAEIWRTLPVTSEFKRMAMDTFLDACREFEQDFTSLATEECVWRLHDAEYSAWEAGCDGTVWSFMDDGDPMTNEMIYCPRCGDLIRVEIGDDDADTRE